MVERLKFRLPRSGFVHSKLINKDFAPGYPTELPQDIEQLEIFIKQLRTAGLFGIG